MENLKPASDTLFILLGAVMVLAMHAGFAFLELGTVRRKNQVNALMKILVDFSVSTVAYFFVGYSIAYGVNFFSGAEVLAAKSGYALVRFFFLLTFAAAVPDEPLGGGRDLHPVDRARRAGGDRAREPLHLDGADDGDRYPYSAGGGNGWHNRVCPIGAH